MPCRRKNYPKAIPASVGWSQQVVYTFPVSVCSEVRLPYSPSTFWMNYRIVSFHENGVVDTTPLSVDVVLHTTSESDSDSSEAHEWVKDAPCSSGVWYSTRWAVPSIRTADASGVLLRWGEERRVRVELQGFQAAYPLSRHYVLVNEEDRPQFLFRHQEGFACGEDASAMGSIHEVVSEEEGTRGFCPKEVEGCCLLPLSVAR